MSKMKVRKAEVEYKGKTIPLISGEFHYWRNFPDRWQAILDGIKEMGLGVISTYIPWNFHELKPGEYDFEGRTNERRNLEGFIELVHKNGLYLIVRPGPYIYSEWPNGGPPDYAVKFQRLDPEFLEYSKDYIDNVCKVLVPRQVTKGGCIIMMQADNEPYPPVESFGDEIGCFRDEGLFKEWLKKKYDANINKLNKVWKADFASFNQPCFYFHEPYVNVGLPMAGRLLPYEKYYRRYADSFEFIGWYAKEIVKNVAEWFRAAGVDVPIYANGWSPYYQDVPQLLDVVELFGMDMYPLRFMKSAAVTDDEWRYNIDHAKMVQAEQGFCWTAEYQSGLYPVKFTGYLPPEHFKYVTFSLMANGMAGWNWYMLVSRDNWYHCPINEWGRPSEYFGVHKEIVRVAGEVKPWLLEPVTDVSLYVFKPHRVISPGNWAGVFDSLNEADVDFLQYNPQVGGPPATRALIYAGSNWLPADEQKRLLEYVQKGGTLIFFNEFPEKDEFGEDCNILPLQSPDGARPVNLPVTVLFGEDGVAVENAGHLGGKVNFFYYREVDGEPITSMLSKKAKEALVDIGAVEEKTFTIGYKKQVGKGAIIHIGSNPSGPLARLALRIGSINWYAASRTPRILTNVWRESAKNCLVIYVNNRDDITKGADIELQAEALGLNEKDIYELVEITGQDRRKVHGKDLHNVRLTVDGNTVSIWRIRRT